MEKMPSASNSPMMGRKVSSEDVESSKKGQPLSVASMVRRFERDNGLDKTRGGELERSKQESRSSSRASSLSSSQGHLNLTPEQPEIQEEQTVVKKKASAPQKTATNTRTVRTRT